MKDYDLILLVEDDDIDQASIKRSMKDLNIANPVHIVENGKEALDYLGEKNNKKPCLILLDLNMPKMNGIEFLKKRFEIEEFRMIPTVVLTTSEDQTDVVESFKLGVAGYMSKPVDYKKFVEVMRKIHAYWIISLNPS